MNKERNKWQVLNRPAKSYRHVVFAPGIMRKIEIIVRTSLALSLFLQYSFHFPLTFFEKKTQLFTCLAHRNNKKCAFNAFKQDKMHKTKNIQIEFKTIAYYACVFQLLLLSCCCSFLFCFFALCFVLTIPFTRGFPRVLSFYCSFFFS